MKQLPPGDGRTRIQLFDNSYRLIHDSATSTWPAYRYVNTYLNAVITRPDGVRWSGKVYRCPEGIKRWSMDMVDVKKLIEWPSNPFLED